MILWIVVYSESALSEVAAQIIGKDFIAHCSINDEWGEILIMEKNGQAFARGYYFFDDKDSFYLDWLSVSERARKRGIGTSLQEMRGKIAIKLGFKTVSLSVLKDEWMEKWYERRGYSYFSEHCEDDKIWMSKKLV